MTYYAPSKELAEQAAERLAPRIGGWAASGADRTVTGYVVEKYAHPNGQFRDERGSRYEWGVVERWRYNDRPDLGEFGGAFYNLTPELLK